MEGHQLAILLGEDADERRAFVGAIQTGPYVFIRFATDEDDFRRYHQHLDAVKNYISNLNKTYETGGLTEPEYRTSLEHRWLNVVVRAFVMEYGVNSVPIDVRNAVNNVAGHLNSDILNDIIIDKEWTTLNVISIPFVDLNSSLD